MKEEYRFLVHLATREGESYSILHNAYELQMVHLLLCSTVYRKYFLVNAEVRNEAANWQGRKWCGLKHNTSRGVITHRPTNTKSWIWNFVLDAWMSTVAFNELLDIELWFEALHILRGHTSNGCFNNCYSQRYHNAWCKSKAIQRKEILTMSKGQWTGQYKKIVS